MNPLDKRYPPIVVNNSFTKEPEANKTFFVKVDIWMPQMQFPAGDIVKEGRVLELKELDQICDFTMQRVGIPYNYPKDKELPEEVVQHLKQCE